MILCGKVFLWSVWGLVTTTKLVCSPAPILEGRVRLMMKMKGQGSDGKVTFTWTWCFWCLISWLAAEESSLWQKKQEPVHRIIFWVFSQFSVRQVFIYSVSRWLSQSVFQQAKVKMNLLNLPVSFWLSLLWYVCCVAVHSVSRWWWWWWHVWNIHVLLNKLDLFSVVHLSVCAAPCFQIDIRLCFVNLKQMSLSPLCEPFCCSVIRCCCYQLFVFGSVPQPCHQVPYSLSCSPATCTPGLTFPLLSPLFKPASFMVSIVTRFSLHYLLSLVPDTCFVHLALEPGLVCLVVCLCGFSTSHRV